MFPQRVNGNTNRVIQNVASEIKPGKELTSKSGTLAYLAPEVYEGRGYGTEVDWWSLGVLFYECIYNKRPFEASNHDMLGQKIVRACVPFPTTNPPLSNVCLHAISSLLEKDRRHRIGAISWESFWDNPFFREIDFEALERKEIEPIFIPATDKTNFDATYDLEELLLEEAPLEARARRQKPRSGLKDTATEKEIREDELHRMIETLFEPFDFTLAQYEKEQAAATGQLQSSHSGQSGGKDTPSPGPTAVSASSSPPRHQPHGFSAPFVKPPSSGQSARDDDLQAIRQNSTSPVQITMPQAHSHGRSRGSTKSPSGSPPLLTSPPGQFDMPKESRERAAAKQSGSGPRSVPGTTSPGQSGGPRNGVDGQRAEKRRRGNRDANREARSAHKQQLASGSSQHRQQPNTLLQQTPLQQPLYTVHAAAADAWADTGAADSSGAASPSEPEDAAGKRPSGMLGFLSRKKGRDRSPKAKERGVLGKEGARQIVGDRG